ncbi:adenylate/guanylate cyclase domain-containing protein [Chlorogloeopsis fritschii PCC 9212]|uniref:Adenylate cyclase n=1 Tax=Chlorogloeopsis fritschii PCC 6912 TaxID=211165 RepID=A0A433NRN1_CHLFR|nr:adenylate/guanylate cyclase domain-containing protein [Chlorogloeopsis fritschii]RUR86907.1 hypothetical protein PCC6912_03500 [Chlorogloeopsis fritschii PCC 6912]
MAAERDNPQIISELTNSKPQSSTKRLTLLYVFSLGIIACLTSLGQIFIQRSLANQELSLKFVSVAQRQQMFSQQLSKNAFALQMINDVTQRQQQIEEMQNIITTWKSSRQELEKLASTSHLPKDYTILVDRMLQQTTPKIMQTAAQNLMVGGANRPRLFDNPSRASLPKVLQIQAAGIAFVRDTDKILLSYNQQVTAEVRRLRQLEVWLFSLTLLILVLEGVFIFRPAVRKISQSVAALARSLQETQETAYKLAAEQQKSEHLLLNILPEPIAERLKEKPTAIADGFAEVSVLFADIVGFTELSSRISPNELVKLLNRIFSAFDQLAEQHGLEKIKTIGDAYMVVGGLPNPRADHAQAIVEMALDMQQAISQFNVETNCNCNIRIGINTGPVVAGVIGIKKFIYDLWGDTVNIASRMESHGVPGCIQITETTYEQVKNSYTVESRGLMKIKGKAEMVTYLVKDRKSIKNVNSKF